MSETHETGRSFGSGSFFRVMTMDLILILLLAYILIREAMMFVERREYLDRLMAKDLPEYKTEQSPEENELKEEKDDSVPIEDAERELLKEDDEEE